MKRVLIIAEAGVNHNGSVKLAKQMIDKAAGLGVDYIKFQTFKTEKIVSRYALRADYQQRNMGDTDDNSQVAMLRRLELSYDDFRDLDKYCSESGTHFLSTPFDIDSIAFLARLGMDYMKVPSGEITNLPYLRAVARTGLPVIMSTGMADMAEIESAVRVLSNEGVSLGRLTLLHCNTEYPTPLCDVNLLAMDTLRRTFGTRVGYSDHTAGIEVAVAAAALGADVIEKHFTLDRNMPGPDHKASLDPIQFGAMVSAIRNVELALGSPDKFVTDSERANREVARKSIVASKDIAAGELFSEHNLAVKRPATGLSPMFWDKVLGERANRHYSADEPLDSTLFASRE